MKTSTLVLVLAFFPASALWASVQIATDHADAMYACGEKTVFTVSVTDTRGKPVPSGDVAVTLDNFGPKVQFKKSHALATANPFCVEGKLDEPGFLRLTVIAPGEEPVVWSVGYDPDNVRPVVQPPADFDAFWDTARRQLAETVPLDPQMSRLPERSTKDFDFYRVSFAAVGGTRLYGYLSVPTDKAKAPFPVELNVPAAGHGSWSFDMAGSDRAIRLQVGVHPFETPFDEKAVIALHAEQDARLKAKYGTTYAASGFGASREEAFFYRVILGVDRAFDWVVAREDADKTCVTYQGTSQGGGMGIILTAFNRHITRAAFYVPALTDTLAYQAGRASGWPYPFERHPTDEQKARVAKIMPYFDAASFATRITCPVRFAVGLADTTCPPHCTWGAYNVVASKDKRLFYGIGMGHGCRGEFYRAFGVWLEAAKGGKKPLTVKLTFDDNQKDMATCVAPALARRGWKGTFNVITGNLKGGDFLTWEDCRTMLKLGHEVADHTISHPHLPKLLKSGDTNEVRRQIFESRDQMTRELGVAPRHLCLPFNALDADVEKLIREAGMEPLECVRPNYGVDTLPRTDRGGYVSLLDALARGQDKHVVMVHGVRTGRGWKAFANYTQFERFLDEIAALEREGLVRVGE